MNVHNDKEDKLEQLQGVLGVFANVKSGNNSWKPRDSEKFKETKHRKDFVFSLGN